MAGGWGVALPTTCGACVCGMPIGCTLCGAVLSPHATDKLYSDGLPLQETPRRGVVIDSPGRNLRRGLCGRHGGLFAVAAGSSPLRYVNLNRSIQKTAYPRPSPEACGVRSDPHPSLAGRAHSSVRVEARAIARSAAPFHVPLPRQQSACAAAMHEGQHGYSDQHYAARCSSGGGSCSLVLMTSCHERAKGSCLFARSWQSLRSPRGAPFQWGVGETRTRHRPSRCHHPRSRRLRRRPCCRRRRSSRRRHPSCRHPSRCCHYRLAAGAHAATA